MTPQPPQRTHGLPADPAGPRQPCLAGLSPRSSSPAMSTGVQPISTGAGRVERSLALTSTGSITRHQCHDRADLSGAEEGSDGIRNLGRLVVVQIVAVVD